MGSANLFNRGSSSSPIISSSWIFFSFSFCAISLVSSLGLYFYFPLIVSTDFVTFISVHGKNEVITGCFSSISIDNRVMGRHQYFLPLIRSLLPKLFYRVTTFCLVISSFCHSWACSSCFSVVGDSTGIVLFGSASCIAFDFEANSSCAPFCTDEWFDIRAPMDEITSGKRLCSHILRLCNPLSTHIMYKV